MAQVFGDAAWIFLRTRFAGRLQDDVHQSARRVQSRKRGTGAPRLDLPFFSLAGLA